MDPTKEIRRLAVVGGLGLVALGGVQMACSDDSAAENTDAGCGSACDSDTPGGCGDSCGGQLDGTDDPCPAATLASKLGREGLLVGGSMRDEDFAQAPLDLRYLYLAGDVPADGPCADCRVSCPSSWWGCWQWDQDPPGRYVTGFVDEVEAAGAIPMITYYVFHSVAGGVEGDAEVTALADPARIQRYLADYRFVLARIAETASGPVLLHVEPDLWGYTQQAGPATGVSVAVSGANADECVGMQDDVTGLAACMIAIARAEAPGVLLGFHASAWGTGFDALINRDASFDVAADGAATASYLSAIGADNADFIVVEMSDRDAGYNDRFWDPTDADLPHFQQAIDWAQAVSTQIGLAHLWWQIPYGHPGLSQNECDRYEDNRVDYVFDHPGRFANAGAVGVAFGRGASCMTSPETDGGHFIARAQGYFAGLAPNFCATDP